jgi:hypothetical protein
MLHFKSDVKQQECKVNKMSWKKQAHSEFITRPVPRMIGDFYNLGRALPKWLRDLGTCKGSCNELHKRSCQGTDFCRQFSYNLVMALRRIETQGVLQESNGSSVLNLSRNKPEARSVEVTNTYNGSKTEYVTNNRKPKTSHFLINSIRIVRETN